MIGIDPTVIPMLTDAWKASTATMALATSTSNMVAARAAILSLSVELGKIPLQPRDPVSDATPGQFAHLFYAPGRGFAPIADGNLCVRAGATGIVRLLPSQRIDPGGELEHDLDIPNLS